MRESNILSTTDIDCGTVSSFSLQIERGRRPSRESGASGSARPKAKRSLDTPLGLRSIWREKEETVPQSTTDNPATAHTPNKTDHVVTLFSFVFLAQVGKYVRQHFGKEALIWQVLGMHTMLGSNS